MSTVAAAQPVGDSVEKVNDEVAVGEDLNFQRAWWRFEHIVWICFTLLIALDLAGAFGRGPLSHAIVSTPEMRLHYERIARTGSSFTMRVDLTQSSLESGKLFLFVSSTLVDELGAQRVIPSPESTTIGNGGFTYVFPATNPPASIAFDIQPRGPGIVHFSVQPRGGQLVQARVVVMP